MFVCVAMTSLCSAIHQKANTSRAYMRSRVVSTVIYVFSSLHIHTIKTFEKIVSRLCSEPVENIYTDILVESLGVDYYIYSELSLLLHVLEHVMFINLLSACFSLPLTRCKVFFFVFCSCLHTSHPTHEIVSCTKNKRRHCASLAGAHFLDEWGDAGGGSARCSH